MGNFVVVDFPCTIAPSVHRNATPMSTRCLTMCRLLRRAETVEIVERIVMMRAASASCSLPTACALMSALQESALVPAKQVAKGVVAQVVTKMLGRRNF